MKTGTRHIPLEGAYNVRDIGGYPTQSGRETRWYTFFRADALNALTPAAQQQLLDYGLRTVIDLRSDHELAQEPNVFAQSDAVRYLNIPLLSGRGSHNGNPGEMPRDLVTVYKYILDDAQPKVCEVMSAICEADAFPVLVHCTAGKDRTGVIAALMLDLAGVTDELIAEDYALTGQYLGPRMDAIRKNAAEAGRDMSAFEALLLSEPIAMMMTLRYLDETYGGAESYLRHIGLTDSQIAHLRTVLVG